MVDQDNRLATYIPNFDKIVQGGFLRGSVNLLSGGPGTGKSIFCMQYLYNGIIKQRQRGLFISFEEDIEELKADARSFGWDFDTLEKKGYIKFIYIYPYEITNLQSKLVTEITKINAERIVIDSTSTFGMALEGEYEVRKELYALAAHLKKFDSATLLTSEIVGETNLRHPTSGGLSRFGVEEFIADSVVTLHYLDINQAESRGLRVVKMRRTAHNNKLYPLSITKNGISLKNKPLH
ncbi:MAG: RAD55 family ATPase [Nanoarchaeota archaeon]